MNLNSTRAILRHQHGKSRTIEGVYPLRDAISEGLRALTVPPGWVKIWSTSSLTFRPTEAALPSVKAHLTHFRVDVDRKNGRTIASTNKQFPDLIAMTAYIESELNELSLKKEPHGSV